MPIAELPTWLVNGVLLGLVAGGAVLLVYLVGLRFFDDVPIPSPGDPNRLRRSEIRAYFATIDEPAIERAIVADEEVAFWLPERDLAVTFDAETYYALSAKGVEAVLMEHEVPGHQIGSRLPFETPPMGGSVEPRGDERDWARETLGLEGAVGAEEIEAAYRQRVLEAHPDRGGSQDELRDVLEAYQTLSQESAPS